jgi:hypothetical protein
MVRVFSKKYILILLVFSFCARGVLSAQTAAEIENLLKVSAVTYAQAARFVIRASDAAAINDQRAAFNYAVERNWLPKSASPDSEARLDAVSLLFMQSFNLKGGLFYSLFKNPHYAYRELEARKAFGGKTGAGMKVSGEQLLFITSRILSIVEGK